MTTNPQADFRDDIQERITQIKREAARDAKWKAERAEIVREIAEGLNEAFVELGTNGERLLAEGMERVDRVDVKHVSTPDFAEAEIIMTIIVSDSGRVTACRRYPEPGVVISAEWRASHIGRIFLLLIQPVAEVIAGRP